MMFFFYRGAISPLQRMIQASQPLLEYRPFHALIHIYIHKILSSPLNTPWTPVFKPIGYSHFLSTAKIWIGPPDYGLWALQRSLHFFVLSLPLSNHGRGYAESESACTSVNPLIDHNVHPDGASLSIHLP